MLNSIDGRLAHCYVVAEGGKFFSLGPPSKEYGGVQVFGRDNDMSGLLPTLLLHIPPTANEEGEFERWALLNSFSIPGIPLGKTDHQQIFHTTRASNGSEWEVSLNKRAIATAKRGETDFLDELLTLTPPIGPPICQSGHILGESDFIYGPKLMRAPEEANLPLEQGHSPRAQAMNRARIECQAFTFSFTEHGRSIEHETSEATLAGKAVCAAAISQPGQFLGPNQLFALKMGLAHHDLLTRHLHQAAEKYANVIRTFNLWDDDQPLRVRGSLAPVSTYALYHDIIPTLVQDRKYNLSEVMYEQMLYSPIFEESRRKDLSGTRKIQNRIDTLFPLVKLRLRKYLEAAELFVAARKTLEYDYVNAFLFEWTVEKLKTEGYPVPRHIAAAYNESKEMYRTKIAQALDLYQGFTPPNSDWTPHRFRCIPSYDEVKQYVDRREPFIISPVDEECDGETGECSADTSGKPQCPPLLKQLGWQNVCTWDADRFCSVAGNKQVSLAMKSDDSVETFSGSTTNTRNFIDFCSYARAVLAPDSPSQNLSKNMGYFDAGSANAIAGTLTHIDGSFGYDFPLDRLKDDIPTPTFLQQPPDQPRAIDIAFNHTADQTVFSIYSATYWLGSAAEENAGECGLHYDALENFHFLLSGKKKWKIYSPADALKLDYILPILNITEDGDIYQMEWDGDLKVFNIQTRFSKAQTVHQPLTDARIAQHPSLATATEIEFELNGGEAVYLPGGWAHDVSSHGIFQSITMWFFRNHDQFVRLEGADRVAEIRRMLADPLPEMTIEDLIRQHDSRMAETSPPL